MTIELASLTTDELVALQKHITDELQRRKADECALRVGDRVRHKQRKWIGTVRFISRNGDKAEVVRLGPYGNTWAFYKISDLERLP